MLERILFSLLIHLFIKKYTILTAVVFRFKDPLQINKYINSLGSNFCRLASTFYYDVNNNCYININNVNNHKDVKFCNNLCVDFLK